MKRSSFTMQLKPGFEAEYLKRHDDIWPELSALLTESGITNYSIFLDEHTLVLYAYMEVRDDFDNARMAQHPIMRRWWDYMADIMEVNPDHSPVAIPLREVFHID